LNTMRLRSSLRWSAGAAAALAFALCGCGGDPTDSVDTNGDDTGSAGNTDVPAAHQGGALMNGGRSADSESFRFIGGMGEGPGANRVSKSEGFVMIAGFVGATRQ
jgi:hypothetical protein